MKLVLDASVAIKLYVNEGDSASAARWIAREPEFYAPDIFLVEVAQALLRHVREDRLSPKEAGRGIDELRRNVRMPLGSAEVIDRAFSLAQMLSHRLHDCMYLALAERLDCPLLTADERLARKVEASGLSIRAIRLSGAPP